MESFEWGIIISMLVFSAFFSGMEIAFVSANKLKIELDGKQGDFFAKIISNFLKKPSRFIGAMLVGNNIALVVYGIFMAKILEPLIASYVQSEGIILLVQTIVSTIIILITAEFLPKTLFRINPNNMLRFFAFPLLLIYWVLVVPMFIVIGISELLIKLFAPNLQPDAGLNFGRIDLEHYIKEGTENNEDTDEVDHEIQIFQNALDFSKVKARDCMIPRTEIVAMEIEEDIESLKDQFVETGLSKILIYRDNIDNIIGYTHSFELFKKPESIKSILLPVPIIAMSMSANEILEIFIEQRKSIAVVVDEFGGTSGILTIEDIIEEIFGDIQDEHDVEDWVETQLDQFNFLISARHEIDYLNEKFNWVIPSGDYDTLGGYILSITGEIPQNGNVITSPPFTFTVMSMRENRIDNVKVTVDSEYQPEPNKP